ncbi:hypothetical protein MAPG_05809 [Magnaporthiopsis poae ATCC 64411]|uniref:Uncharacterized protein n=1 Tax=Magnaporthiopsis poae (strain ATCC 64411 / 73-15) TaxID=644358 RepID=A0A0C4E0D6_MAGP6|nr:hypothetical protein MAPG_05809 [Magnaporthiopsis poae ATCC 64411]
MGFRIHFRRLTAPGGRPSRTDKPNKPNKLNKPSTMPSAAEIPSTVTRDEHLRMRSRVAADVDDHRNNANNRISGMTRLENIWEAEDFVRQFVLDGWGQYVLDQATIRCDMTLYQLRRVGRMQQTDGVRACRRLVHVPVLCDEVAYQLWTSLAAEEEEGIEEAETEAAGVADRPRRRLEHNGLDKWYTAIMERRAPQPAKHPAAPVYMRCGNCGGLCKSLDGAAESGEEDEGETTPRTLFRCMECSHVLKADVKSTSSDDSEEDGQDEEGYCEPKNYTLSRRISSALRRRSTTRSNRSLTDGEDTSRPRRGSLLPSPKVSIACSLQHAVSTANNTVLAVAENLANFYVV